MAFSNAPFDAAAVKSSLSADDYAKVCLINLSPPGKPNSKAESFLPVRETPNGAYNTNAIKEAATALAGSMPAAVSPFHKQMAARQLIKLMKMDGAIPGPSLMRIANMKAGG